MEKNQVPPSPCQHHHSVDPSQTSPVSDETPSRLSVSIPQPPPTTSDVRRKNRPLPSPQANTSPGWPSNNGQETYLPSSMDSGEPSATTIQGWPPAPTASAQVTPDWPANTASSSSLLTSEPLNRSASTHNSPLLHDRDPASHPSTFPSQPHYTHTYPSTSQQAARKRARATSLPVSTPIYKRRKSSHFAPLPVPSDPPCLRTLAPPSPNSTCNARLFDQTTRAAQLGRELLALREKRPSSYTQQYFVACRQPPINVASLRSLDASEILKNPQLRHDLLFDSLAFRPVTTDVTAVGSGESRTSSVVSDMYWESIAEEIRSGCRCTRWKVEGGADGATIKVDMRVLEGKKRVKGCVCGKWRADLNEAEWWKWQEGDGRWPSRLPEMIKTLREILISLMGSTTPCANHFAHSFSPEALAAHESTCPTVTHALVPELYAALDPEFLAVQVRRGVFGVGIFEMLGEAMKVHCAPVRDGMVDAMVRCAVGGDVVKGLRKCFDCVEVMKLDIANHQVHALRPYLWTTATNSELCSFTALLGASHLALDTSLTRRWIKAASVRVLSSSAPSDRMHLIGRCACKGKSQSASKDELVVRSLAEGFVELVFADRWAGDEGQGGVWPPVVSRRMGAVGTSAGAGVAVEVRRKVTEVDEVPESLRMDVRRIRNFHADVVDLTIFSMVLEIFKDSLIRSQPNLTASEIQHHLVAAHQDLSHTLDQSGSITHALRPACPARTASFGDSLIITEPSDLSIRLATRIMSPSGPSEDGTTIRPTEQVRAIMNLALQLDRLIRQSTARESAVFQGHWKRSRAVIGGTLRNMLLAGWDGSVGCQRLAQNLQEVVGQDRQNEDERKKALMRESADLARERKMGELEAEVKSVVAGMYGLAKFNLGVFKGVYEGLVVG